MSNPTTPFSWQMPTATDLVTDLPADFEVFGQAVATSMADLLGGTSGQILAKNSNTDMDFVWIANDQGDITGVTAGTGITITSPTGPVPTITNSMATAIDAKGDLVVGTGADAFSRLAVGATNGMVLTVDSAEATGLKYATPTAPPTIKTVRKSSDQTVTSSTTLVNDSQLLFAVAANETYIFQAWLYTYAADGTPDIKVTFTGPSGSTVFWSSSQVIFNAAGATTLTVVAPGATTADLFVDANLRAIQLYGTILNGGTAGNLQFQFAQNTSSANGTSVKAGSSIFGIKV
jgi:hypothetical protein